MMLQTLIATLQEKLGDLGNVDVVLDADSVADEANFAKDGTGDELAIMPLRSIVTADAGEQTVLVISGS